ncbi:MAG: alpha-1,2-fucosyltransferase [Ferruginibacter sp.]
MKKSAVYILFPKTGLGNMLLVWANALVFAKKNQLPLVISGWWGFHWGAIVRREAKKRLYFGYFKETPLVTRVNYYLRSKITHCIYNPSPVAAVQPIKQPALFVYNEVITHEHLFEVLEPHLGFIRQELYALLTDGMRAQLDDFPVSGMSVHIRRGDFKISNQATAISFFIKGINAARSAAGYSIPVTLFTDAEKEELAEVLSLGNILVAEKKADILDILLMSKSKILILSQSSTFSYWSAFLSEAFVILKHDDWQHRIRHDSGSYAEHRFNADDPAHEAMLVQNVSHRMQERKLVI